jgi:hypothetical protein
VVLATKFAAKINDEQTGISIDGRPEHVRTAYEASLRRLGTQASTCTTTTASTAPSQSKAVVPPKSWRLSYAASGLVLDSLIS